MRSYAPNTPQAMARFIAMFIITDGRMDPEELESLEKFMVYELLGLGRKQFMQVLTEYCDDISDEADEADGTIHLIDPARLETLIDDITDPEKRILTCALAMDIAKSMGDISEPDITLLRYIMSKWDITLDDIAAHFAPRANAKAAHAQSPITQNALE